MTGTMTPDLAAEMLTALRGLVAAARAHDDACPAPRSQKATDTWEALHGAVLDAQIVLSKAEGRP